MSLTTVEYDLEATMRDGVVLRADVYRPSSAGPWPVLLVRTPYDKQDPVILGLLDPLAAIRRTCSIGSTGVPIGRPESCCRFSRGCADLHSDLVRNSYELT